MYYTLNRELFCFIVRLFPTELQPTLVPESLAGVFRVDAPVAGGVLETEARLVSLRHLVTVGVDDVVVGERLHAVVMPEEKVWEYQSTCSPKIKGRCQDNVFFACTYYTRGHFFINM